MDKRRDLSPHRGQCGLAPISIKLNSTPFSDEKGVGAHYYYYYLYISL